MGRRFITARDIDDLLARGEQELLVDDNTVLTDLAREHARDRGVRVVTGAGPRVAEDVVAERPPAVTQAAAPPRAPTTASSLPRDAAGEVSPVAAAGGTGQGSGRRPPSAVAGCGTRRGDRGVRDHPPGSGRRHRTRLRPVRHRGLTPVPLAWAPTSLLSRHGAGSHGSHRVSERWGLR